MTTPNRPAVSFTITPAATLVPNQSHRVLLIGQQNGGTATSGDLQKEFQNDNSWDTLFGSDSQISAMLRAYKKINLDTRVDAIGLDDNGSATAATGTVVFSGTATEDGSFEVTIGSDTNHKFTVTVTDTDSATVVGGTLETVANADANLPVTAANVTGTVTMTAVNGGTEANRIGLRVTGTVAGLTATVTGMTGGLLDPVLTTLFDPVANERYQSVVYPFGWGITDLAAFLDPRFNVNNEILDGSGYLVTNDTFANLKAIGDPENSQNISIISANIVNKALKKSSSLFELDYVQAAQFSALVSLRLTTDASIADFVVADTTGGLDAFGGPATASLPYHNTVIPNLPQIDPAEGFSQTQLASLIDSGISVVGNNTASNAIVMGEIVTLYKTDEAGNPDDSFKFLNFVHTASQSREFIFNNLKKEYAQSRLTEGDLIANRSMANEQSIRAFIVGLYQVLTGSDFVLLQAGPEAIRFFKQNLSVSLDLLTGKVTVVMKVPLVTQLRTIIATMQLAFSVNG